jgi:hypothetical protein
MRRTPDEKDSQLWIGFSLQDTPNQPLGFCFSWKRMTSLHLRQCHNEIAVRRQNMVWEVVELGRIVAYELQQKQGMAPHNGGEVIREQLNCKHRRVQP